MIKRIKLLRNIGSFLSDSSIGSNDLKKLVLIHAENGRGKTTLAAIFRSLATGNPDLILERRRLGIDLPPHVVFAHDDFQSDLQFRDGTWTDRVPNLRIFDDAFVNENVYSGLDVDSQHRQNLHELILGEEGVSLNREHQTLVDQVEEHNRVLRRRAESIPVSSLHGLDVDVFCALPQIPDIDAKITAAERTLAAAQSQDEIERLHIFQNLQLRGFDVTRIEEILSTGFSDLDRSAEERVQSHVNSINEGGEAWVAEGMRHVEVSGDTCPFCGQDLNLSDLLAHYRAYFGEEYRELRQSITREIGSIECEHTTGQQTRFERSFRAMERLKASWSSFLPFESISIETEAITDAWQSAAQVLTDALAEKQSSPLEERELDDDARQRLEEYDQHRNAITKVNEKIDAWNEEITEFREGLGAMDLTQIETELNRLRATKERYSSEIEDLCANYLAEQESKSRTERCRDQARTELANYRNNVFPELQSGVNEYLGRFNAGYRIDRLRPRNTRSGSDCTYNLVINDIPVQVARNVTVAGEASFRNTLSAGDRNTLALALYLSALDNNPNLEDTLVILDDPKSSFDDHRSLRTAQETRRLTSRARQVIVLSHDKRFLCDIWQNADRSETVALEITKTEGESSLVPWEVSDDAFTEHDRRHRAFHDYVENSNGNEREVAMDLRLHLEGYFRVMCPDDFPAGTSLGGNFVQLCSQRIGQQSQILDGLKLNALMDILQYAHRFHHDTNPAWQSAEINSGELRGFVKDVLKFVGP